MDGWHEATELPPYCGVYRVDDNSSTYHTESRDWFAYWDGLRFGYRCHKVNDAFAQRSHETGLPRRCGWKMVEGYDYGAEMPTAPPVADEWHSEDEKPNAIGPYMVKGRKNPKRTYWSYWDGESFGWRSTVSPEEAVARRNAPTVAQPRAEWKPVPGWPYVLPKQVTTDENQGENDGPQEQVRTHASRYRWRLRRSLRA